MAQTRSGRESKPSLKAREALANSQAVKKTVKKKSPKAERSADADAGGGSKAAASGRTSTTGSKPEQKNSAPKKQNSAQQAPTSAANHNDKHKDTSDYDARKGKDRQRLGDLATAELSTSKSGNQRKANSPPERPSLANDTADLAAEHPSPPKKQSLPSRDSQIPKSKPKGVKERTKVRTPRKKQNGTMKNHRPLQNTEDPSDSMTEEVSSSPNNSSSSKRNGKARIKDTTYQPSTSVDNDDHWSEPSPQSETHASSRPQADRKDHVHFRPHWKYDRDPGSYRNNLGPPNERNKKMHRERNIERIEVKKRKRNKKTASTQKKAAEKKTRDPEAVDTRRDEEKYSTVLNGSDIRNLRPRSTSPKFIGGKTRLYGVTIADEKKFEPISCRTIIWAKKAEEIDTDEQRATKYRRRVSFQEPLESPPSRNTQRHPSNPVVRLPSPYTGSSINPRKRRADAPTPLELMAPQPKRRRSGHDKAQTPSPNQRRRDNEREWEDDAVDYAIVYSPGVSSSSSMMDKKIKSINRKMANKLGREEKEKQDVKAQKEVAKKAEAEAEAAASDEHGNNDAAVDVEETTTVLKSRRKIEVSKTVKRKTSSSSPSQHERPQRVRKPPNKSNQGKSKTKDRTTP
ncbi:uncharacterized protein KY384_001477 [Bacidia gigantensis]|uniref:uncharacterized protein n=1 Tax=Bacidia gigantensis TaxID=2732470 RepID=UPI001D046BBD|nr:uncharacterized protein KY384_001477 [Bacidia gigantensis]KAG8533736.1 hypothetical protein KY384_001477 [Bacidia gigantensis]